MSSENQENPPELMTVREAAQWFRVHEDTIRRNLKRGILPGRRVGRLWRLVRADVEAWLRNADLNRSPALADPSSDLYRKTWKGTARARRPALFRANRSGPKLGQARGRE